MSAKPVRCWYDAEDDDPYCVDEAPNATLLPDDYVVSDAVVEAVDAALNFGGMRDAACVAAIHAALAALTVEAGG